MAITQGLCTSYKAEILEGVHTLSDVYKVALYTSSASLDPSVTGYTTTNECSGGNYPAGGIVIPTPVVFIDTNVAILSFNDAIFINLTLPDVRGCMIYNSSKANKSVALFNFGGSQALVSSDFTLVVPAPTATLGLIRLQ